MSYDMDYGPYHGAIGDPRTPEDNGREEFEAFNAFVDFLDEGAIEEILNELMHGNPASAKADLEKATEAAYQQWLVDSKRQADEDRAADMSESLAWARDAA